MANTDARLPLSASGARMVVRDVWRFALRPTLPARRIVPGRTFAFVFAVLLALDFTLAGGTIALESFATSAGHEPPPLIETGWPLGWELAAIVLFAPLMEEAIFRGWLPGTRAWLRFALHIAVAVALLGVATILADVLPEGIVLVAPLFALGLMIFAAVRVRERRNTETDVPAWYEAGFRWFVWGSTLAFGAVHLGNFDGMSSPLDLLMILSQTTGGLILAYNRLHLGLGAAIAQHAIFNATFAGLALAINGTL